MAFILSLFASQAGELDAHGTQLALVLAIICGVLAWASALRAISSVARSIDHVSARLRLAAQGDLTSGFDDDVSENLPELGTALDQLISQVRHNLDSVQALAMFDPVTGLANRVSFCRQVESVLLVNGADDCAAMIFIDLDGFKQVNDTLGHAVGDQLLIRVATRLRDIVAVHNAQTGQDAIIGRLAGDEFTIFAPGLPDGDAASDIADAVRTALREPFDIGGARTGISASVGVAYYPRHGRTLAALLRSADHAMYEAKNSSGEHFVVYSDEIEQRLVGRAELERDLRTAIEGDEFLLEYQPQIHLGTGRIVAAEALLRWMHPRRSVLMPEEFIGLAQETGLIVELGRWVMDRACATAGRWADAGIDHRIALNITARELSHPEFFEHFEMALSRHDVRPDQMEFEISEALAMRLEGRLLSELHRLHRQGLRITLDDFGTGMSNMSRISELPIDRVKIDRSLVRGIVSSAEARTICSAMIAMVNGLGREVLVEGVENATEQELLRLAGCSVFQGFHVAAPSRETVYRERFGQPRDAADRNLAV